MSGPSHIATGWSSIGIRRRSEASSQCHIEMANLGISGRFGLRVSALNGTADSKFIVRPVTATLSRKKRRHGPPIH